MLIILNLPTTAHFSTKVIHIVYQALYFIYEMMIFYFKTYGVLISAIFGETQLFVNFSKKLNDVRLHFYIFAL